MFAGAAHPLLGRHRKCEWPGHGENGLGDAEFAEYVPAPLASSEHAAKNALVRLLQEPNSKLTTGDQSAGRQATGFFT